jgi:hypothetical protein
VHNEIVPVVKRDVSDRMSCMALNGRWCDIIVLTIHLPGEDKIYDRTKNILKHNFFLNNI